MTDRRKAGALRFERWRTAWLARMQPDYALALGVMAVAIALLCGIAVALIGRLAAWGTVVDATFVVVLLLDVALLFYAHRRLRDLRAELRISRAASDSAVQLAAHDPLTDLLNRRGFMTAGAAMIADAESTGASITLIAIEVDRFKDVGRSHGPSVGNTLLVEIAQAILGQLPPHAIAARLDGEAFACMIRTGGKLGGATADQIVRRLGQPLLGTAPGVAVSASVGYVVRGPGPGPGVEALLGHAEAALYSSKRQGGARAVRYGPILEKAVAMRAALETDLRAGIAKGEFVPFYQMQIDLETGALQGFEVLARWHHPQRGLIAPDEFLPVAELAGLTGALSTVIMRAAFEEARLWNPMLMLTVNVSRSQLHDPWFAQKLLRLLLECEFPAERLELDIPEDAIEDNLPLARSLAESLRREGVRLAFDNFGTGQCSLANIRALPFDRIKLDRSVVQAMGQDRDSDAVAAAVGTLAASLGLPVVAGGIADEAIRKRVAALGFKNGQGWHLGKPFAVDSARALLAERGLLAAAPSTPSAKSVRRAG